MPQSVPNLAGLRPLSALAEQWHLRPSEVKAMLLDAGVVTLTLSVSGRRVELVVEAEASAAIARRLLPDPSTPPGAEPTPYVPMIDRLDAQGRELEALRAKLTAIEAGLRGGS